MYLCIDDMKRRLNKLLAYCCFALLWVTSIFPMWVHYLFSDMMYLILYRMAGYRTKIVRKNINTAFPEKSDQEVKKIEREFYHWFCDYLVETIKMMTISEKEMRRRMVFKGTEAIEKLWNEGVSCGIMLGHYCNWEWISTLPLAVSFKGVCAELYHPIENPDFDRLFLYLRQRFGSVCIPMERRYAISSSTSVRVNHWWLDILPTRSPTGVTSICGYRSSTI